MKDNFLLTNVWIFYYKEQQHQRIEHWQILLYSIISMKNPRLMASIVNIRECYLIVVVVEQLIVMLANRNHWLFVLKDKSIHINDQYSLWKLTDFFKRIIIRQTILWIITIGNIIWWIKRCWRCHQHGDELINDTKKPTNWK